MWFGGRTPFRDSQPSLRRDLYRRLLWLVLPIVLTATLVHGALESRALKAVFDESLVEYATTLATLVTVHDGRVELEFADEYMPRYSSSENPSYFQIWLPDGTVLERSVSLRGADLPLRFGTLDEPRSFVARLPGGRRARCVGIRFPVRQGTIEDRNPATSVVVVVGAEARTMDALLLRAGIQVALTAVVSTLGIAIMVFLALRHGMQVVERIGAEVQRITPGALDVAFDEDRVPAEVRPLVASLNRSLTTIRRYIVRERRFNADVAHELRTPIAELRAAAEIASRWPDDDSNKRLLEHSQAIASRMGRLVESLLELAQLESGLHEGARECLDLSLETRSRADEALRADAEGRRVRVHAPEPIVVVSHPTLWEVVLRNLLENALSYSPAASTVDVRMRREGDGVRLEVTNPTRQDFDGTKLERCKERLWRGDPTARATDRSGLGLSIVEAACERLGHTLELRFADGSFCAVVFPTPNEHFRQSS